MTADAVGGVFPYALDLVTALSRSGVEVHLAVLGPAMGEDQRALARRAGVASLHEDRGALEWMPDPWEDVDRSGAWLLQLAHEVQADVVHLGGYAHAALPWPAPTVVVAHSDVLSWWRAVHGEPAPPQWDTYRRRVADGLRAADLVVAPTRAVLHDLQREYALGTGVVVHHGRDVQHVPPLPKEPLVLGAGRLWDEAKNLHRVARVAPRLPWPVALAGDASGAPLPEGADLLGRLPWPELSSWMQRAAVLAAPSSYEPFGLTALEAAHAGCALVLGDLPSQRELWGEDAVYVDGQDEDALAAALLGLAEDPGRTTDLGRRARARAQALTIEAMATAYLRHYRSLQEVLV